MWEVNIISYYWIVVIIPIIYIIMIGLLFLRKRPVVLSTTAVWIPLLILFVLFPIVSILSEIEFSRRWGTSFDFGSVLIPFFPMLIMILFFGFFMYLYRNGIMIYNIQDFQLSDAINKTLKSLKLEYDRDFSYINIKNSQIKIKVAMIEPMRSAQIFLRGRDRHSEKALTFIYTLKENVLNIKTKPFYGMGIVFILVGIMIPIPMLLIILF